MIAIVKKLEWNLLSEDARLLATMWMKNI